METTKKYIVAAIAIVAIGIVAVVSVIKHNNKED